MAWIHLVMRPFFATLSDSFGRRHLMSWGRFGTVAFFAFHRFRDRSPWHRMVMENVCWPPSNSCWPVFAAAHSDLFGSRPELSAQIQAADGFWSATSFPSHECLCHSKRGMPVSGLTSLAWVVAWRTRS